MSVPEVLLKTSIVVLETLRCLASSEKPIYTSLHDRGFVQARCGGRTDINGLEERLVRGGAEDATARGQERKEGGGELDVKLVKSLRPPRSVPTISDTSDV